MAEDVSPTLLRRQLGRFLRERRQATGLTLEQAAVQVQLSFNALQRLEAGRTVKPRRQDVRELCMLYEVDADETEQAVGLAFRAATAKDEDGIFSLGGLFSDAFNMYVGMERSARRLVTYQEQIPGLLQTSDYARAVFRAFPGFGNDEDIQRRIDIRLKRQVIVTRKANPLAVEVLLNEAALRRVVGGKRVMAAQLKHLADLSTRSNVTLRVQPYAAGYTWGFQHGPFVLLDFGTAARNNQVEPPVVYVEGRLTSDLYVERLEDVQRYSELADAIRAETLDEVRTRDLVRQIAREFDRER
ncbi:helix-turn-helix domain-containing protein [Nocardia sp. NPDC059091]|uniref:helix-turn-helix domain-containing protein n=1 Tax=Nocardia sp. NPDC059091 TaxID=3346724 RepID=UPI0036B7288D